MVFNKEDTAIIKVKKFISVFPSRKCSLSSLSKVRTKLDQTSNVDCKPGNGRKRKIAQNVESFDELVLSRGNVWALIKRFIRL